jgi:hypothetical protein
MENDMKRAALALFTVCAFSCSSHLVGSRNSAPPHASNWSVVGNMGLVVELPSATGDGEEFGLLRDMERHLIKKGIPGTDHPHMAVVFLQAYCSDSVPDHANVEVRVSPVGPASSLSGGRLLGVFLVPEPSDAAVRVRVDETTLPQQDDEGVWKVVGHVERSNVKCDGGKGTPPMVGRCEIRGYDRRPLPD